MAFTVRDLINQNVFPDIKLMAGKQGAGNEIMWVNIMEILDSPKSVQPGELLFTTGYGLQEQELYRDLLPQLSRRGVSGMAVQPGYYLDSIPSYILEQADALKFPVLLLPKELTFSEILHTMTRLLTPEAQKSWSGAALNQAGSLLEQDLAACAEQLFPADGELCVQVLLLEPVNFAGTDREVWNKCLSQIGSFILSSCVFSRRRELDAHKHAFLAACRSEEDSRAMLYSLSIQITLLSERYGANYYLGAARLRAKDELTQALKRAKEVLTTLDLIHTRRGACSYDHLEFVKVLGQMHRKDSSVVLDNQSLQLLLNYDRANDSNYVRTLRVYLSNNCNMTRTARQLFLHRQTLIKRLEKISAIGNLDLEDYYSRTYMSMALLFHDYFIY